MRIPALSCLTWILIANLVVFVWSAWLLGWSIKMNWEAITFLAYQFESELMLCGAFLVLCICVCALVHLWKAAKS